MPRHVFDPFLLAWHARLCSMCSVCQQCARCIDSGTSLLLALLALCCDWATCFIVPNKIKKNNDYMYL